MWIYVASPVQLANTEWHIPTSDEYMTLVNYINCEAEAKKINELNNNEQ